MSPDAVRTADADSFRRAMRWYPAAWRAEHGDAMLGALLDQADAEGRRSPGIRDHAELAWHGVRERVRRSALVLPASVRDRAATLGLGMATGLSLVMLLGFELAPLDQYSIGIATFGPFRSITAIAYLLVAATWVVALLGAARVARVGLFVSIGGLLTARVLSDSFEMWLRADTTTVGTIALLLLVAAMGRVGGSARASGTLAVVGILAFVAWALPLTRGASHAASGGRSYFMQLWPFGGEGASDYFAVVPAALFFVALVLGIARRRAWAGALALVAVPLVLAVVLEGQSRAELVTTASVAVAVVVVMVLAGLLIRALGLRIRIERTDA